MARQGRVIRWEEVRERLARVAETTGVGGGVSPAEARRLMEARARRLAEPPPRAPAASEVLAVVTFALGRERYGIEARHVREIIRPGAVAPVPGTPGYVVGLTNLRGELLLVVDLRTLLGVEASGPGPCARVIVLGEERAELGLLTDAVDEVVTLATSALLEPPAALAGAGREHLRGVTKEALSVLDGRSLLVDPRLFVDQGAACST